VSQVFCPGSFGVNVDEFGIEGDLAPGAALVTRFSWPRSSVISPPFRAFQTRAVVSLAAVTRFSSRENTTL